MINVTNRTCEIQSISRDKVSLFAAGRVRLKLLKFFLAVYRHSAFNSSSFNLHVHTSADFKIDIFKVLFSYTNTLDKST